MSLEKVLATAREFAVRELRPVALAYDESEAFPRDLLDRAAGLGLTCYDLPAAYGGGGLERLEDQIEVIEELTWGDSAIAPSSAGTDSLLRRCSRSAPRSRSDDG